MSEKKVTTKRKIKSVSTKNTKISTVHHDKFLFNMFLFIAVMTVFNFVFYIVDGNNKNRIQIQNENLTKVQTLDLNSGVYSKDGIAFNYPKTSKIEGSSGRLKIDNWVVNFYSKSTDFSNFEKWFNDNFDSNNCFIKSMDSEKGTGLSYSLYFLDGVDCRNNGLYMVGNKKIGKIVLGVNPNDSYEQVLASIKF